MNVTMQGRKSYISKYIIQEIFHELTQNELVILEGIRVFLHVKTWDMDMIAVYDVVVKASGCH